MVSINNNGKVTIRWNVKSIDYSEEKLSNIKVTFSKKYNIPIENIKVEPIFIRGGVNSIEHNTQKAIQNIHNPQFQQNLFWNYLEENNIINEYDKDLILSIDSQINSQIDYDSFDNSKRYDIKYIKWKNFLSYGEENYFDFTKLNGVILLNGKPANQSGKSTFAYDLIHYALFGKTSSDKARTLSQYFNYNIPDATEMLVETCLEIDGVSYIIRRRLTRPEVGKKNRNKITQKVEWFKIEENGDEVELIDCENKNSDNSIQTNKAIKEALGNEKDFDLVICANSDNLKDLIALKDTERGKLLSRWTGLDVLDTKDVIARETYRKKILPTFKSSVYNRSTLKEEIDELNLLNTNLIEENNRKEQFINTLTGELNELEVKKNELYSSLKPIDSVLVKTDISTVQANMEKIKQSGIIKRNKLNTDKERLNTLSNIVFNEDEYKDICSRKEILIGEIATIKAEILKLKDDNKKLSESEYCPVCKRKYENIDNSGLIEENKKEIETKIKLGIDKNTELTNITNTINELDKTRALNFEKDKLTISLHATNAELTSLLNDYNAQKTLLENCLSNENAIKYNNDINASINVVNETIRTKNNLLNSTNSEINVNKNTISHNNKTISEKEAIIEIINNEEKLQRHWEIYLQMIGKNGICKIVLRGLLPTINLAMTELLEGVCDFKVEIFIDDNNDVAFNLSRNGIIWHLGSGSGFEQTVASLALRVVLGNIGTLSKPPFILLDEVFGGVAKDNYPNIQKLLNRISQSYRYIFIITHEMDVKEWANNTITVVKENGISRISC